MEYDFFEEKIDKGYLKFGPSDRTNKVTQMVFSLDSQFLFAAMESGNFLKVRLGIQPEVVKSFGFLGGNCPEGILSLAMVGNKLWSGLKDGALRLWDGKRGRIAGGRRKIFKIGVKKIIGV